MKAPSTAVSPSASQKKNCLGRSCSRNAATSVHGTHAIAVSAIMNRLRPLTPSW